MSEADARTEIENLMNAMIPLAIQKLEDAGEFAPFGGAMSSDGDIFSLAETNDGQDALGDPDEMIESLKDHMREAVRAGAYKATAIVFDVEVNPPEQTEKTDAVAVALDHGSDVSVVVLFPYTIENRQVSVGEVFATEGDRDIFTD